MSKSKIIINFLLASLKTLPQKIVPKATFEFLFQLSFSNIGSFSPVYIICPTFETIFRITGDFETSKQLYRVTGCNPTARTSFLKKVILYASRSFLLDFFTKKAAKNLRLYKKYKGQ